MTPTNNPRISKSSDGASWRDAGTAIALIASIADFRSLMADRVGDGGNVPDSINSYGVVAGVAARNYADHRALSSGVVDHQFSERTGGVVSVVAGGEHVLHGDRVGGSLAHSLECGTLQALSSPSIATIGILEVTDFMRDNVGQFSPVAFEQEDSNAVQKNRVGRNVRMGIEPRTVLHHNPKSWWHGVRLNPALGWIFSERVGDVDRDCLKFDRSLSLTVAQRRKRQDEQQRNRSHDGGHFSLLPATGQAALSCHGVA